MGNPDKNYSDEESQFEHSRSENNSLNQIEEQAEKKAKAKKNILMIGGGAGVVALLLVGYIVTSSNQPQPPLPNNGLKPIAAMNPGSPNANTNGLPGQNGMNGGQPLQPGSTGVNNQSQMNPAVPNSNGMGNPVVPSSNEQPNQAGNMGMNGTGGNQIQPQMNGNGNNVSGLSNQTGQTLGQNQLTPGIQPAVTLQQDLGQSLSGKPSVANQSPNSVNFGPNGVNNTVNANGQALSPINQKPGVQSQAEQLDYLSTIFVKKEELSGLMTRIEALEAEIAGVKILEDRIQKIEEKEKAAADRKQVEKKKSVVEKKKPAKEKTQPKSKPSDEFFNENDGQEPTSKPQENSKKQKGKKNSEKQPSKQVPLDETAPQVDMTRQNSGVQLVAIVQGRAWVKMKDGTMQTVAAGDFLPNGAKVIRIDPDKDEVKTSDGILK